MWCRFGWTECVGCADRAAYDLSVHAKKTGVNLNATELLKEPIFTDEFVAEINKKTFGKHFGRDTGAVQQVCPPLPSALSVLTLGPPIA